MRIICTLFCLCYVFIPSLLAQQAHIYGRVLDTQDGFLVAATISSNDIGTISDFDGNYTLNLPAGKHQIEVSYIGYQSTSLEITLEADEQRQINFVLHENTTLLQTATVTSGRYEKPLSEATVSLEVIKPDLIENNNSTSVDDILNKVPGVNIIDGQANIRGGSGYSYGAGSRVMLLIDDIPALQADAGRPNWGDIPIENIEQIEVIKGAASALYGSSALNGIVNVRTAYAKSEPITKASVFGTLYDAPQDAQKHWWQDTSYTPFTVGASFAHRQKFKKLDFVTSAYYLYRDSYNERTWNRNFRTTLGLRYRINDRFNVGFNGIFNTGNNSDFFYWHDGESGAYRGNEGSFSKNTKVRFSIDPFITYFDSAGNRHKFLSRIYSVDNRAINNQSNQSTLFYGEYQFQRKFEELDMIVTAGLLGSTTNVDADLYGGERLSSQNAASYLQLEKKFFDKLSLSGGMRYEYNDTSVPDSVAQLLERPDQSEGKLIFRLGTNYQLTPYTFLRASWGQGYRYPTIAEKYIATNVGFRIVPNYNLQSETGWSTELGVKQGFRLWQWEGFADVSVFWSQYADMMEFNLIGLSSFQSNNVGDTDIKGIDLSIAGRGKIGLVQVNLIGGYTYIDPTFQNFNPEGNGDNMNLAEVQESGDVGLLNAWNSSADYNILKYRYKHTWKFDIEGRWKNISLALAGFYLSNMEAIDYPFELFIPDLASYRAANDNGATVFDVRLGYYFDEKTKLSLLVKNVLNEEYRLRPALLEAPRNFTVKLEKTF